MNKYSSLFNLILIYLCFHLKEKMDLFDAKIKNGDLCLVDIVTTHTILKRKSIFSQFQLVDTNVNAIFGIVSIIEGFKRAYILLHGAMKFSINNTLYSSRSKRKLLSSKNICRNGYHIQTTNEDNI